ncbi:hypothetical protein NLU13_2841 [Sarocladium strictum]|uniref:LysM domain-containing protein n=1 Tax=Sarocladium strictum TaxID=5046 RepID=A0AA39L970_SARSR|nr:hypothetical protein NLU13_2841 [Sarocladium strictum]
METCCTCARILTAAPPYTQEKAIPSDRRVPCCGRVICGECIQKNSRFAGYCPFCQISTVPSSLPQGLKKPPAYASVPPSRTATIQSSVAPPPYKAALAQDDRTTDDTLHFLNHEHDSIASLSLRYGVPASALRRANNINSDHLLLGRKTVLIPGEFYKGGVSMSPQPVDGEEEELRKGKIRRFMTSCKIHDYDVAVLYLQQHDYDLVIATEAYVNDEEWERSHPGGPSESCNDKGSFSRHGSSWR